MATPPAAANATCPVCGRSVDKLRAGAMGIYGETIRYFCSPECKGQFGVASFPPPAPVEAPAAPAPAAAEPARSFPEAPDKRSDTEPDTAPASRARGEERGRGRRLAAVLLLGGLAAVTPLFLPPVLAASMQAVCVLLLLVPLCSAVMAAKGPERLEEALPLLASAISVAAAVSALLASGASAAELPLGFAAGVAAICTLGRDAEARFARQAGGELRSMLAALPRSALLVRPEGETETDLDRVRAGEEVLVPTGEIVPVDGVVRAGEATTVPLPFSEDEERVRSGDLVIAGAKVTRGELRLVATFVGAERTLARVARLGQSPKQAPLVRGAVLAARIATALAIGGAVVVAALETWLAGRSLAASLIGASSVVLAMSGRALGRSGASPLASCIGRAAKHGAFFRDAAAVDAAARVGTVVLPARGTVTTGVPSVTNVERIAERDESELLGLAAAATAAAAPDHPVTQGLLAAASARTIDLPEVRRPAYQAGRGVLGAAPGGENLVVGSRQLLLSEGVSIAAADEIVSRLEGQGRTTILVAAAGKVQAVIGLCDAPRPEARHAVEKLDGLGIEPVLLTGDSRTTAESLGESLGVDHVRAQVEPEERASEVRRLTESGTTVAVIGHPARDGAALDSADVAIALKWAGAPQGEPAVRLAGDRVTDAVQALAEARAALGGIRRNVTVASSALVLGAILAVGGLLPPPGAALIWALASVLVARESRR
ncbi:MAG: HAD-IC family P-type ATPase [Deltaproteobacteria bacterium]|nr:HAD-IC family P-type ATPase [Deltaproteobacteria bacterium]